MGTLPQAVEVLHLALGEPAPRTKQIGVHLRDAKLVPKSVGKRLEHLGAVHIATFILALSAANRPADAAQAALTWGGLTLSSERHRPATGGSQLNTLLNFIAGAIDDVWTENGNGPKTEMLQRSTIEITITVPHAIIDVDRFRLHYLPPGGDPPSGRQRVDRIPGDTLRQIAMALREGAR